MLGALSVVGVYLVTTLLLMATVYLRDPSGGRSVESWNAAAGLGIVSFFMAVIVVPGMTALGAVAGAIYVPIKRRLGLFGAAAAVPAAPPQSRRRSATFWVAVVLGIVVLGPVAMSTVSVAVIMIVTALATPSGPHCKKVDPIIVRVGDRVFAATEDDDPSLYGKTIRQARRFQFCQERPPGSPFTADSLLLRIEPRQLGYESSPFSNIQLRIVPRSGETEWSSFQRAQDRMNAAGLTFTDLPREGSFLVLKEHDWRHFIAADATATTPSGQPITFWCDMIDLTHRLGERCSVFYAWSEGVHFSLSFNNKPFLPDQWLALHEAARQFLANAEHLAAQKQEE